MLLTDRTRLNPPLHPTTLPLCPFFFAFLCPFFFASACQVKTVCAGLSSEQQQALEIM